MYKIRDNLNLKVKDIPHVNIDEFPPVRANKKKQDKIELKLCIFHGIQPRVFPEYWFKNPTKTAGRIAGAGL
ncbi:MAG: hypothetical protein WC391_04560 [Methanoregula sp.]|jgi:hypothetical protein